MPSPAAGSPARIRPGRAPQRWPARTARRPRKPGCRRGSTTPACGWRAPPPSARPAWTCRRRRDRAGRAHPPPPLPAAPVPVHGRRTGRAVPGGWSARAARRRTRPGDGAERGRQQHRHVPEVLGPDAVRSGDRRADVTAGGDRAVPGAATPGRRSNTPLMRHIMTPGYDMCQSRSGSCPTRRGRLTSPGGGRGGPRSPPPSLGRPPLPGPRRRGPGRCRGRRVRPGAG